MKQEEKLNKLNIGCGNMILDDHVNLDKVAGKGIDCVFDLETCGKLVEMPEGHMCGSLPFADDYFDEVYASHILEHIDNILPLMQELHRVTKSGGKITIRTPYGSTNSAFDDPTHIRQMFPKSFEYFGQPNYHRADYGYRGDWKVEEVIVTVLKPLADSFQNADIDLKFALEHLNNIVHELLCTLLCIKPIREPLLELQEPTKVQVHIFEPQGENSEKASSS